MKGQILQFMRGCFLKKLIKKRLFRHLDGKCFLLNILKYFTLRYEKMLKC